MRWKWNANIVYNEEKNFVTITKKNTFSFNDITNAAPQTSDQKTFQLCTVYVFVFLFVCERSQYMHKHTATHIDNPWEAVENPI